MPERSEATAAAPQIGGISPGILPWDAAHVSNRFVVPLRQPKNYGINSRHRHSEIYFAIAKSCPLFPIFVTEIEDWADVERGTGDGNASE